MVVTKPAPDGSERRARQINRLRVEYVLALRGVLDAFATANGSPAAYSAAKMVRSALNSALMPDELEKEAST